MENKSKFKVYDIVEVISDKPELRAIRGKKGTIRGISGSEKGSTLVAYAVDMPVSKKSWFIFEDDLKATGRQANPENIETDSSMSVDRHGNIVE